MCQGFSHYSSFLHHFVYAKLATISISVNKNKFALISINSDLLFLVFSDGEENPEGENGENGNSEETGNEEGDDQGHDSGSEQEGQGHEGSSSSQEDDEENEDRQQQQEDLFHKPPHVNNNNKPLENILKPSDNRKATPPPLSPFGNFELSPISELSKMLKYDLNNQKECKKFPVKQELKATAKVDGKQEMMGSKLNGKMEKSENYENNKVPRAIKLPLHLEMKRTGYRDPVIMSTSSHHTRMSPSYKTKYTSPLRLPSSPREEGYDQPMDLSRKTPKPEPYRKPVIKQEPVFTEGVLDLSKGSHGKSQPKSHERERERDRDREREREHERERNRMPSIGSSLAQLEKKFGGNFDYDRFDSRPRFTKDNFATKAFASAIYSAPLPTRSPVRVPPPRELRPVRSPTPPPRKQPPKPHSAHTPICKTEPVVPQTEGTKLTNFGCSCQKSYSSLYELSLHIQETGHTPNTGKTNNYMEYPKLVRGQDMWLNQGSEQTRQILRCMQCGESFKSLPELTVHMMQTRHYTNIVNFEGMRKVHRCSAYCEKCNEEESVFKCKVCQETFTDMEGLANHMVLSGHHKKQVLKNANAHMPETPPHKPKSSSPCPASTTTGTKRSISTPTVASLLEYKRKFAKTSEDDKPYSDESDGDTEDSDSSKIQCENCLEKIETPIFVEHVRACVKNKTLSVASAAEEMEVERDRDRDHDRKASACSLDGSDSERENDIRDEVIKETEIEHKPTTNGDAELDVDVEKSPEKPDVKSEGSERSLPPSPLVDYSGTTPLESTGSSALKAMENFIEKSFSKEDKVGHRFTKNFIQDDKPKFLNKIRSINYLPDSTSERGQDLRSPPAKKIAVIKPESGCNDDAEKDNQKNKTASKDSDGGSDSENSMNKYILEGGAGEQNPSSSALESLRGLVYRDTMNTEHPLDSLQKLIANTDIRTNMVEKSPMICSNGTLVGGGAGGGGAAGGGHPMSMASTVILVNPIVTVVQQPKAASPHSNRSDDNHDTPSPGRDDDSPQPGDVKTQLFIEADPSGEFKCQACNRTFASKGSYRYHLSRCHLSSVKKYGIKEAFNMSPYIYLPLDHTAKFSKYYQMAKELANKASKETKDIKEMEEVKEVKAVDPKEVAEEQ